MLRGQKDHRDDGVGQSSEQVGFMDPLHKGIAESPVNSRISIDFHICFQMTRRLVGLRPGAVLVQSMPCHADNGRDSVGMIEGVPYGQIRAQE